jgi:hypothetical protein
MASLVFLVENIAIGLYVFIGLGIVWAWRRWGAARQEYRETYFELERGMARDRVANAVTVVILLMEAALFVLGVQRVVAPTIRAQDERFEQMAIAPEDGTFSTPTPFQRGDAAIDDSEVRNRIDATDPALAIQITPTLTPTPVGTIVPNPPEVVGCDTENASLQIPTNGLIVFEPIEVIGRASVDNFAFYRFEIRGESTLNEFAILSEYTQPLAELGSLGQFTPSFYEPGEYQFRLNVFDINGDVRATCMVNIIITDPIPTPTPLAPQ